METEEPGIGDQDPVAAMARTRFGVEYLYPWQRLVMANVLDAVAAREAEAIASHESDQRDDAEMDEDGAERGRQIVLLPTGAGKSLCFQVPAFFFERPTLVVFPLVALMADQERRLRDIGVEPAAFRGGQSAEERERAFALLEGRDGNERARIVIANPEVLASREILARLARIGVAHLAIDEAHCVSEWGDTFRPAYLTLAQVIGELKPLAVTAFTATASPDVLERMADALFAGEARVVRGESDRPNIAYAVRRCHAKEPALAREAARREWPLVVFCATRGGAERTALFLREALRESEVRFYHAGLTRDEKKAVESWFHGHDRAILTATCAWGMGIDKRNVRTVIHRDAPPTAESYAQEAGRAGRDGLPATAVLLWSPRDRARIASTPALRGIRARSLVAFAEGDRCRRETLLEALGDPRAGADAPEGKRVACSGCDVCEGNARDGSADGSIALAFVRRNRRRHTRNEAAEILTECGNAVAREAGLFPAWKHTDFLGILNDLEKEGAIRELGYWPWKGTLTVTRPSPRPRLVLPRRPFFLSSPLSFPWAPRSTRARLLLRPHPRLPPGQV